jgi:predicted nucleic-acid-binding Zn-ribbon protein
MGVKTCGKCGNTEQQTETIAAVKLAPFEPTSRLVNAV